MKDGFLLIDKEVDWTSRDVCNKTSHIFNTKKVGHTGTLDPFATGLLIVAFGSATKVIPYLENLDKTYIAELTLGKKTDTADLTGKVIEEKDFSFVTKEKIIETLKSFLGEQEQVPPMTSAIHINGQKLYQLAHQGQTVEREPRKINVYELNLVSFDKDRIVFSCRVSKGTYIRTLGEDIAEKMGTVGHLTALRRTKISSYSVNEACKITDASEDKIIDIKNTVSSIMNVFEADELLEKRIKNGAVVSANSASVVKTSEVLFVSKTDGKPLAIYSKENDEFKCQRGLWKQ